MPIEYQRDDVRKRVVMAVTGPLDLPDARAMLRHHRTGGAWTYGLLYDLRLMTERPPKEALREFAVMMKPGAGEAPRGPAAIVVTDPVVYASACAYAVMVKADAVFDVFQSRDEADQWVTGQGY